VVLAEKKTVLCAVCFAPHDEHPEEREDTWNGKPITGGWAQDYTYVWDFYQGNYTTVCKSHDREEISERKMRHIDSEYAAEKALGL
jgi:hypothetical protein